MNIMHYDYSDKTTVPTELLQDPYLSVDTKGLAAILCSFGKEAFELSELNKLLKDNISDERMDNILTVPIHLKMTLTAREAAEYSNIGINKIDSMLRVPNCPFVLFVGTKKLVKRREFEEYISQKLVT